MNDPTTIKRDFIRNAIKRAQEGSYPIVEPRREDNEEKDLKWWIRVFDAKAFLFSENGSATWLFPHYELKVKPLDARVVVSFGGTTIVDSRKCVEFYETAHPAQIYIPRSEIDFAFLKPSETHTYCPFKNIAGYYSVEVAGQQVTDAFWYYEDIYDKLPASGNADGILEIRGMLSPDRSKLKVEVAP